MGHHTEGPLVVSVKKTGYLNVNYIVFFICIVVRNKFNVTFFYDIYDFHRCQVILYVDVPDT